MKRLIALTLLATVTGAVAVHPAPAADITPPIAGIVNNSLGADITFQTSTADISANWSGFSDPDSGIVDYQFAIGTFAGGEDVLAFMSVGLRTSMTRHDLPLVNGSQYFVTIRAINGDALQTDVSGNGLTINNWPLDVGSLDVVDSAGNTGTVTQNSHHFVGQLDDPDFDDLKLQVEMKPAAIEFDGTITTETTFQPNGSFTQTGTLPTLPLGSYHYRARAVDIHGAAGPWSSDISFSRVLGIGVVLPSPPAAPNVPSPTSQRTSDGVNPIPLGSTLLDTAALFRGLVSDPSLDNVQFQVELQPVGTPFAGTPSNQSAVVATGTTVDVVISSLTNGPYRWRFRAVDSPGGHVSAWTDFGGNDPNDADFVVSPTPTSNPSSTSVPASVFFSANAAGVVLYEWDFDYRGAFIPRYSSPNSGDVTYVYKRPGNFTARVRITHTNGTQTTIDVPVSVATPTDAVPVVTVGSSAAAGTAPLAVTLTAAATPSFGKIEVFYWDFDGDGIIDQRTTLPTVAHTFGTPGKINARVSAVDSRGITAANTTPITVTPSLNRPSIRGIAPSIDIADVGPVVTFTGDAIPKGGRTLVNFRWDFGDDKTFSTSSPTGARATHQYAKPGTYEARLTVRDNLGEEDDATIQVTVAPVPALRIWFLQPRNATTLSGTGVTLHTEAAPALDVAKVDYYYRASNNLPHPSLALGGWTSIGTATSPPFSFFSVKWDTSALAAGAYDLLAVATSISSGTTVESQLQQEVTVIKGPGGATEDAVDRSAPVDPGQRNVSEVANDIKVEIAEGGIAAGTNLKIHRNTLDPHPGATAGQGLVLGAKYHRTLSLDAGSIVKPVHITLQCLDANKDNIDDETLIAIADLRMYRYDTVDGKWIEIDDVTSDGKEDRIQGSSSELGDIAVGGKPVSAAATITGGGGGGGGCGLTGAELALLAALRILRRRKRLF